MIKTEDGSRKGRKRGGEREKGRKGEWGKFKYRTSVFGLRTSDYIIQ